MRSPCPHCGGPGFGNIENGILLPLAGIGELAPFPGHVRHALPAGKVAERRIGCRMLELVYRRAVRTAQHQGEFAIGGESGAEPAVAGGDDLALAGSHASGKFGDILCLEIAVANEQRKALQGDSLIARVHNFNPGVYVFRIVVGGDFVKKYTLVGRLLLLLLAGRCEQHECGEQDDSFTDFHHLRIPSFLRYSSAFLRPPVFLITSSQYS